MLGRNREAIAVLERAHQIAPEKSSALSLLVEENLVSGNLQEAQKWENELRKMGSKAWADNALGLIRFAEGDLDGAQDSFESLTHSTNSLVRSQAMRMGADLEAERGHYQRAVDLLTQSLAEPTEDGPKLLDRAYAYGKLGNFTHAASDIEAALQNDSSPDAVLAASVVLGRLRASSNEAHAANLKVLLDSLEGRLPAQGVGTISQICRLRVRGEILCLRAATIPRRLPSFAKPPVSVLRLKVRNILAAHTKQ